MELHESLYFKNKTRLFAALKDIANLLSLGFQDIFTILLNNKHSLFARTCNSRIDIDTNECQIMQENIIHHSVYTNNQDICRSENHDAFQKNGFKRSYLTGSLKARSQFWKAYNILSVKD